MTDLWETLKNEKLPLFLYGMGNGGDKMLEICRQKGIGIAGVFCSDGFERGKSFHDMPVKSYSQTVKEYGDLAVLLSFASSRAEVIEAIAQIDRAHKLYIPDLPVAGKILFDSTFYEENKENFARARSLFADEHSKAVFDAVIKAKMNGKLADFFVSTSTLEEDFEKILHPEKYKNTADLGAYDGDSARFLFEKCRHIEKITAFEPDEKTFSRLVRKTQGLKVEPVCAAAWNKNEELFFTRIGNRGSAVGAMGNRIMPVKGVCCDRYFENTTLDFIKIDVEGAEKRALEGLHKTITRDKPEMLVSCYHRPEDLFDLPLYIAENHPFYRFYLRRQKSLPAWDINLYCVL